MSCQPRPTVVQHLVMAQARAGLLMRFARWNLFGVVGAALLLGFALSSPGAELASIASRQPLSSQVLVGIFLWLAATQSLLVGVVIGRVAGVQTDALAKALALAPGLAWPGPSLDTLVAASAVGQPDGLHAGGHAVRHRLAGGLAAANLCLTIFRQNSSRPSAAKACRFSSIY